MAKWQSGKVAIRTILCAILILLTRGLFGQEILNETTIRYDLGNGRRAVKKFVAPQFYYLYDSTLAAINMALYTRDTPTSDGYKRGVWTAKNMIELPDSMNATLPIKISDRQGNYFWFKPAYFVRYWNGNIDTTNYIKISNVVGGVSTDGNTITYMLKNGSKLKLTYRAGSIKQELLFSEADRRAIIKMTPNANYFGIAYEYGQAGDKYQISANTGKAWTISAGDTTFYPVYDLLQQYNGRKFWMAGVTKAAFWDTLGHPGSFVIDPTITIRPDAATGKDAQANGIANAAYNYGITATGFVEGSTTQISEFYIAFELDTIPAGQKIDAVICSLKVDLAVAAGGFDFRRRRVTSAYSEGGSNGAAPGTPILDTLTYNNRPSNAAESNYNFSRLTSTGYLVFSDDSLLAMVRGWYSGKYANHGFVIQSQDTATATRNYNRIVTSDDGTAANRPSLTIIYSDLIPNVYAGDSLRFGAITDSSAKILNIATPALNDTANSNRYSVRYRGTGLWVQPADSSDNPYNAIEGKRLYSNIKNITLNLVNNYDHIFEIRSYAANGDSLKTTLDTLRMGTPAAGRRRYIDAF